jgi:hypothetical protein
MYRRAVMHGCTVRSTPRPLVPRPPPGAPTSTPSSAAAQHSTSSAHPTRSRCQRQPHAMRSHHVRCPPNGRRWQTLTASRGATAAPMVAAVGTLHGATAHLAASEPMSALRTLTLASGPSPSARSHSAGCSHDTCASKRPMVDSSDAGDWYPCLRTFLFPISPAGHTMLPTLLKTAHERHDNQCAGKGS